MYLLSYQKKPNIQKQAYGSVETMEHIKNNIAMYGKRIDAAIEYQYFTTSLYALTHILRANARKENIKFYKTLTKYCRKTALKTLNMELNIKQKIKSLLVFISPTLMVKISILWRYKFNIKQRV